MTVAVGTSNCGTGGTLVQADGCAPGGGNVTFEHGQAWAELVNNLNGWVAGTPNYAQKIAVAGAIDSEPAWNYAKDTRDWTDGYDSSNERPYYFFGSCDGCPYFGAPRSQPGSPNNLWTLEDIYYVSYGNPAAIPLPQIYTTNGSQADQWYVIKQYALSQNKPFRIQGALTQLQACKLLGPCPGADNSPAQGWSQLSHALNEAVFHRNHDHGPYKQYDLLSKQPVLWLSDMSW